MILSESEARKITSKVLALSKAEFCVVSLGGHNRRNLRFALNSVTTSGQQDDLELSITSTYGTRSGSASTNESSDEAILAAVRKSEEMAALSRPHPELVAPLGRRTY